MKEYIEVEDMPALWAAVEAMLSERKAQLARGPRSWSELAGALDIAPSTLNNMRHGRPTHRRLAIRGPWPSLAALLRGMDVGDVFVPVDADAFIDALASMAA